VDWISIGISLLTGMALGMLLLHFTGKENQQLRKLRSELAESKRENDAYRKQVSDHFTRTAMAVNQLTESYRTVHDELRVGASELCDNAATEQALASDASRLIESPVTNETGEPVQTVEAEPGIATVMANHSEEPAGHETPTEATPYVESTPEPPRDYAANTPEPVGDAEPAITPKAPDA